MRKFLGDFELVQWKRRLESYYRWRALRDNVTTEAARKRCQEHMDRIKAEYPQYKQAFED